MKLHMNYILKEREVGMCEKRVEHAERREL